MGESKDLNTELFKLSVTKDDIGQPHVLHPIIETHCHLDYLKEQQLSELLEYLGRIGVEKVITISVAPGNLDKAWDLANNHEQIFCSQGIHPHEAKDYDEECEKKIRQRISHPKVVAVGEIGLDYYYDNSPRDIQIKRFEEQMQIAVENDMPVIIHSRDADEDMMSALKNFSGSLKRKGVIHSFTSGRELAETALDQGFHLGFNGIITFKKAENVREILSLTPMERILIETDSPFLTPVPFRGRENSPAYLPFVADRIAIEKSVSADELLKATTKNAHDLFSL